MATLRNLSIGVIRLSGGKNIAAALRYFAWNRKKQGAEVALVEAVAALFVFTAAF